MPREIKTTLYTLKELREQHEKTCGKGRTMLPRGGWTKAKDYVARAYSEDINELITDCIIEVVKGEGYPTSDVRWSLNSCQGDGVSFLGTLEPEHVKHQILGFYPRGYIADTKKRRELGRVFFELGGQIVIRSKDTRYVHENTMVVDCNTQGVGDHDEDLVNDFEQRLQEDVRCVARRAEERAYKTWVSDSYDDDVLENFAASNEMWFHVDGHPHHGSPDDD